MSETTDNEGMRVEEIAEQSPLHVHSVVNTRDRGTLYIMTEGLPEEVPDDEWIVATSGTFVEVER